MEAGIFDEYLVKLGFDNDPAGYAKFKATLSDAAGIAESSTKSIVSDLGKWQGAILGGFAAIGSAALGIADKVADADLGYQLLATKMFMGVDAAKQLSIATNVLGYSLDEIAWNPQLLHQFDILLSDQQRMTEVLGHGYERGLYNIREIKFEFERLQDTLEYGFLPNLVSNVFEEISGGNPLAKLQDLNEWVIDHLPEITSFFSKHLVPILKDTKFVLGDVVDMFEHAGLAFTNVVGLLSGDHSIEGTTFSFENMADAIDHVSHGLAIFVGWIDSAEKMLTDLVNAIVHTLTLKPEALVKDIRAIQHDSSLGGVGILGAGALGTYATAKTGAGILKWLKGLGGATAAGEGAEVAAGAGGSLISGLIPVAGVGLILGTVVNSLDKTTWADALRKSLGDTLGLDLNDTGANRRDDELKRFFGLSTGSSSSASSASMVLPTGSVHSMIDAIAAQYGVNPALAHAMAMQESGEQQYDAHGNVKQSKLTASGYAKGVFQLEDSTASMLGVNSLDAASNISGGLHYISQFLNKYNGNTEEALAAYNWGPKHVDDLVKKRGGFDASYLPPDVQQYIASIEHKMMQGEIHVTNNIYPSPSHNSQEIAEHTADQTIAAIRANSRRQSTSSTAALGSAYQ
jgi:Transglycosylase SLT domain